MLLALRSLFEAAGPSGHRLNTPTSRVPRRIIGPGTGESDPYGQGTNWPVSCALPEDYHIFDIGSAMMIRVLQWQAAVLITKTEILTENSSLNKWTWTETATGTFVLTDKTMTDAADLIETEKQFAQDEDGHNAIIEPVSEYLQFSGGGISGVYDPWVGPDVAFTGSWDEDNNNFINFETLGMEIFDPVNPKGVLGFRSMLSRILATMDFGTGVPFPSAELGFVIQTDWLVTAGGTENDADCTITIPRWDGVGNISVTTSFGHTAPSIAPPAGYTRNSLTFTGSVTFTPVRCLDYEGIWDSSGNPLEDPFLASI